MSATHPPSPPTEFDPVAWLADYEALGGRGSVMQRPDGSRWFGLTIPRGGSASYLQMAIVAPERREAVADFIAARDGVMVVPRQVAATPRCH